jgi:hypothetical protein
MRSQDCEPWEHHWRLKDNMVIVELIRLEESDQGTVGMLRIDKQLYCATLEPADRENETGVSSIPAQQYSCRRYSSAKYPKTFEVCRVPGRTNILFHSGNTAQHTHGCILLGQHPGKLRDQRAVLNSGATFKRFMDRMNLENEFSLTIKEEY